MSQSLSKVWLFLVPLLLVAPTIAAEEETLPPLLDGRAPKSIDDIWGGFDPQKEPLEVQVLKEWTEDGLVCRIVRYRVGVFKGAKSWMAGLFAFPKGGTKLPGLIQIHGGGQSANLSAATTSAKRGYACLSLNWGGNQLNDGKYQKLWDTPGTDWGAIDATHPPKRDPINHFATLTPNEFTLDEVESPRNSAWLLVAIGVRRGLTFLEQQPEVDGTKLGIYGHSMGGKLTVLVAALDSRVKAAVPSCGGISDYPSELHWENSKYCARVNCPILFLNPVNDFYGNANDLGQVVAKLPSKEVRLSCAANLNHRDRPEHFVCGPLWFDCHLKGAQSLPRTPDGSLQLQTAHGIPVFTVTPDASRAVKSVDVFFTQQTRDAKHANPCWHHVKPVHNDNTWTAELPLLTLDQPVRAYANVSYALDRPISGAGYYYGVYNTSEFVLSSRIINATPEMLKEADVKATDQQSLLIEAFDHEWQKCWYVFHENGDWPYRTNKLQDLKWLAPDGAPPIRRRSTATPAFRGTAWG